MVWEVTSFSLRGRSQSTELRSPNDAETHSDNIARSENQESHK